MQRQALVCSGGGVGERHLVRVGLVLAEERKRKVPCTTWRDSTRFWLEVVRRPDSMPTRTGTNDTGSAPVAHDGGRTAPAVGEVIELHAIGHGARDVTEREARPATTTKVVSQ